MPKTITYAQLREASACFDQRELFRKTFGEEVTVTHELVPQVVSLKFDIGWASDRLLTTPALDIYLAATAQAEVAYRVARKQAQAAYSNAHNELAAQARTDRNVVSAQASAVYWETIRPALVARHTALAHAFVDAYLSI